MKCMRDPLAAGIGLLLIAGAPAAAAVSFQVADLGDPSNGSTAFPGFQAYQVTLVANGAGELISAVDMGGGDGNPRGLRAAPGSHLLQRWDITETAPFRAQTPQSTTLNGSGSSSYDSHLLTPASARTDASAPNEDNNLVNPPGSPPDSALSDYGQGTFLTATFGIQGPSQSSTLPLFYAVIPDGTFAVANLLVSTNQVPSQPLTITIGVVPEPGSAALVAGLSAAGLLARRRRARAC